MEKYTVCHMVLSSLFKKNLWKKNIKQTISQEKVINVCNLYTSFKTPIDQTQKFQHLKKYLFKKKNKHENCIRWVYEWRCILGKKHVSYLNEIKWRWSFLKILTSFAVENTAGFNNWTYIYFTIMFSNTVCGSWKDLLVLKKTYFV